MVILLFWGINFLKGKNLFTSSHTFYTSFDNVQGLNVSADVLFRGIKVGTVTDITFDPKTPDHIVVEFTVGKKYPLPNDSHVTTNSPIIGNKTLIVEYGRSPEMYRNGDQIPSISKPDMLGQLTDGLGPVKEQLTNIVNNLAKTLDKVNNLLSEENLESISGVLSGANYVVNNDLRATMANVNAITRQLNQNMVDVDRILANVGEVTDSLSSINLSILVDNINQTVTELNGVVTKLNEGDGTISLLLNDPALYQGLQSSSENLNLLLEDLRSNPKRYVHFSLFGRKN